MLITKSLFVDYMDFPKLAWWKVHDKEVYNKIRKIETEEDQQHIIQIGQAVEDAVLSYLDVVDGRPIINLIPDFHEEAVTTDVDDDDDGRIDDFVSAYPTREALCEHTLEAIRTRQPILYQPSFQVGDCFVRADMMVLQPNGQYDLIEVKAKSGVRKEVTDDGEKKKIGQLQDKFIHDLSFQKYVINTVLATNELSKLGKIYIAHLNKEYVKDGQIDYRKLITLDQIDIKTTVSVIQRNKETTITRNDVLLPDTEIQILVKQIHTQLLLSEEDFNRLHPFQGNKYLEYFAPINDAGKLEKPFGTIYAIPKLHHSKASIVQQLHEQGDTQLLDLQQEQKELFYSKNGMGSAGEFIELYCAYADGTPHVDKDSIQSAFDKLSYPICFYDYESVSTPIPFMDNTYPYQQVVVQYSLHKLYPDGTMKHYGGVLGGLDDAPTQTLEMTHDNIVAYESDKVVYGSYKKLLETMLADIGDDIQQSSFVVRYKPFENTRNEEIAKIFPDLADSFLRINAQTFDLMEVFSQRSYFDIAFKGSASIKKVLPVLVPEMSYDGLDIGNGAVAMKKLYEILDGDIADIQQKQKVLQDLLIYCGQDSLAMIKIFQKLQESIG